MKLGLLIDAAIHLPLLRFDVGIDAAGEAGLHHLADNTGGVRDSKLVPGDAKRRPADEEFVRFVPQEDARPLRSEQPRGRPRHFGQQRHHLLCLLPTGGDFQNGL